MPKEKQKMLILDYDSDTTAAVRDTLAQHSDVTFVDNLKKVAAKAKTGKFDVIVTGYLVPSVSGKKTVSTLNNIKKAISQAEADVEKKRTAGVKKLREAEKNQARIIELLTGYDRESEVEKLEAKKQIQGLEEKLAEAEKTVKEAQKIKEEAEKRVEDAEGIAEAEKKARAEAEKRVEEADKKRTEADEIAEAEKEARAEAEDKAEAALISKTEIENKFAAAIEAAEDVLKAKVASLSEELKIAVSTAETAVEDRRQLEAKLARFQENWEKYVAGQEA